MHLLVSPSNYRSVKSLKLWLLLWLFCDCTVLGNVVPATGNAINTTIPYHEKAEKLIATELFDVANYSRHYSGDVFYTRDYLNCDTDICVGLSSGTAGLYADGHTKEIDMATSKQTSDSENCKCQCLPNLNTYREDLSICVDDIRECTLAPFVSGSTSERIPFVFLPLRGQIIHPSKEISFPGVKSPVCAVSGSQFMTRNGWSELRNPTDKDVPFRLFRDEKRTFLQWLGEAELRPKMQGRLVLVHLMCRDMLATLEDESEDDQYQPKKNIFTPCVAFRVVGTPIRHINNVTEVMFASETQLNEPSTGLSTKEYIVIAICSLCLGLIYITSVFLYIHIKKKKDPRDPETGENDTLKNDFAYQQNDQVTFGAGIGRGSHMSSFNGAARSSISGRSSVGGSQRQIGHRGGVGNGLNLPNEEMGVVKNNPLLKHYPLSDNSGFMSDTSNSNSEFEDARNKDDSMKKNMQTAANIHPSLSHKLQHDNFSMSSQESERLPEEGVSITEEMTNEDKLENMKAIVNGSTRRKLYFNPAYFEPHLLLSPPPAAVEFLSKIREVISIAKYKMAAKRFQPSLLMIPEEAPNAGSEINANRTATTSRKSSFISSKVDSSKKSACSGCPGCGLNKTGTTSEAPSPTTSGNCKNCGDKQSSIRKWLESVSSEPDEASDVDGVKPKLEMFEMRKTQEGSAAGDSSSDEDTVKGKHVPVMRTTSSPPKVIPYAQNNNALYSTGKTGHDLLEKIHNAHASRPPSVTDYVSKVAANKSDLYSNPQFLDHSSPVLSQRGHVKPTEILDQYANPRSMNSRNLMRNLHHMPDMVYEALAMDINKNNGRRLSQSPCPLPTPDYTQDDESQPGTFRKYSRHSRGATSDSSDMDDASYYVPTPDYNTLSKRSEKRYQPDSPIYSRKSPYNLIVDYETDSLERATLKNRRSETSPSHASSELSSQPSPSLSTALPLEEEVEIRNAIYDRVEGFRKDTDTIKKERELYGGPSKNDKNPKIIYDSPFVGSMTIELEHSPEDCQQSTDSDQFEPDTLDRKPKKLTMSDKYMPTLLKTTELSQPYKAYLPKENKIYDLQKQILEKSSSPFRSRSFRESEAEAELLAKGTINHIKEKYEQKDKIYQEEVAKERGKILSLEQRHSKRQRKLNEDPAKKLAPPDIVSSVKKTNDKDNKAQGLVTPMSPKKMTSAWLPNQHRSSKRRKHNDEKCDDHYDSHSQTSESTEFTRVSDTGANSEFGSYKKCGSYSLNSQDTTSVSSQQTTLRSNKFMKPQPNDSETESLTYGILETFMTIGELKNKNFLENKKIYDSNKYNDNTYYKTPKNNSKVQPKKFTTDDFDKIDIISTKSLSQKNFAMSPKSVVANGIYDAASLMQHGGQTTKVFRVEINPSTHGMQIAMGLRDRVKKTKDLKNAWKRFIGLATSKFNNIKSTGEGSNVKLDADYVDRDEGISSLIDENFSIYDEIDKQKDDLRDKQRELQKYQIKSTANLSELSRTNSRRSHKELDSGYMSAESNESRLNKKMYYERYSGDRNSRISEDGADDGGEQSDETLSEKHDDSNEKQVKRPQPPPLPPAPPATENPKSMHTNSVAETPQPPPPPAIDRLLKKQHIFSLSPPAHPPPPPPIGQVSPPPTPPPKPNQANLQFQLKPSSSQTAETSSCSAQEEHSSSENSLTSTESGDGSNEFLCESGAESVETSSVFFKQMRKLEPCKAIAVEGGEHF